MNNILILIPDGTGIRNYLYSALLSELKGKVNLTFWSTLPIEAFQEVKSLHGIEFDFKQITLHVENVRTRLFRESATYARLIFNTRQVHNKTIQTTWNYNPKRLKLKILYKIAQYLGARASKDYNSILNLEQKSQLAWSSSIIEKYKSELTEKKITKIFITHQRIANLNPICIAAKELCIEVLTVIYSWDNLPKARLNVMADKYLVWSEHMKREMQTYYPEISKEKVIVTGTPQFEFYLKPEHIISRDEFAKKYNLYPNKKWILYSGDDTLTSPYDQYYLNDLAIHLREQSDFQIIFRRSPADFSNRFDVVLSKFKDLIISIDPDWYHEDGVWGATYARMNDISLLVNLTYHCDAVVNVGSTMAFDFGMYSKACFYINYDQPNFKNWSVNTIYELQHFKSMPNKNAVGWVNSKDDFYKVMRSNNTSINVKPWFNKIVYDHKNASKNILEELIK